MSEYTDKDKKGVLDYLANSILDTMTGTQQQI